MVDSIVGRLLKRHLEPYIDGLSSDGLSVLQGRVALQNLSLKTESLGFLRKMGILVKSGKIGALKLQMPVKRLMSGDLTVELQSLIIDVVRVSADVPPQEEIIQKHLEAKQQTIEQKVRNLAAGSSGEEEKNEGWIAKYIHKLTQNIHIEVGGGVVVQLNDPKQRISCGLLIGGVEVKGLKSDDDKGSSDSDLRKVAQVTDLAAYISVDGAAPRYALQPTVVKLKVEHTGTGANSSNRDKKAKQLAVSLQLLRRADEELCDQVESCAFEVSKLMVMNVLCLLNEVSAWSRHEQKVIQDFCKEVDMDEAALQPEGALCREYVALYRRKEAQDYRYEFEAQLDLHRLWAIELAVLPRYLAQWRFEVITVLQRQEDQSKSSSTWTFLRRKKEEPKPADDAWQQIQAQVRQEQASVETLAKPVEMTFQVAMTAFRWSLYDDGSLRIGQGGQATARPNTVFTGLSSLSFDSYKDLSVRLDAESLNFRHLVIKEVFVTMTNPNISVNLEYLTLPGKEEQQLKWSAAVDFGSIEAECAGEMIVNFKGSGTGDLGGRSFYSEAQRVQDVPHDIKLRNVLESKGEVIDVVVDLPPTMLQISPWMLATLIELITVPLPEPPTWEEGPQTWRAPVARHCPPTSKPIVPAVRLATTNSWWVYNYSGEYSWQEDMESWAEQQKDRILEETAKRVEGSELGLLLDVKVVAPQITIVGNSGSSVHLDLGVFHLKSNDIVTAGHFDVKVKLEKTSVTCKADDTYFPLLTPIDLSVTCVGKPSAIGSDDNASSDGIEPPVDVDLRAQLRRLRLEVHPQAIHLLQRLSQHYQPASDKWQLFQKATAKEKQEPDIDDKNQEVASTAEPESDPGSFRKSRVGGGHRLSMQSAIGDDNPSTIGSDEEDLFQDCGSMEESVGSSSRSSSPSESGRHERFVSAPSSSNLPTTAPPTKANIVSLDSEGASMANSRSLAATEPAKPSRAYNLNVTVQLPLVFVGLLDMGGRSIAKIDAVGFRGVAQVVPSPSMTRTTATLTMQAFSVEVCKKYLMLMEGVGMGDPRARDVGEALKLQMLLETGKAADLSLNLSPLQIEWRKKKVMDLIAALHSLSLPDEDGAADLPDEDTTIDDLPPEARATLRRKSSAWFEGVVLKRGSSMDGTSVTAPKDARDTKESKDDKKAATKRHKAKVNFAEAKDASADPQSDEAKTLKRSAREGLGASWRSRDVESREVAKRGLLADGQVPALKAEHPHSDVALSFTMKVHFGGLEVRLYRSEPGEDDSEVAICPAWISKNPGPFLEFRAKNFVVDLSGYSNSEKRIQCAMGTYTITYDGKYISTPLRSDQNIFECSVCTYMDLKAGGPVHSVCFSGKLRGVAFMFYKKHLDSILEYMSESIFGALIRKAAESTIESVQENVALWSMVVETSTIHIPRDKELLKQSPAWVEPKESKKQLGLVGPESPQSRSPLSGIAPGSPSQALLPGAAGGLLATGASPTSHGPVPVSFGGLHGPGSPLAAMGGTSGLASLAAMQGIQLPHIMQAKMKGAERAAQLEEIEEGMTVTVGSIHVRNTFHMDNKRAPPFACQLSFGECAIDIVDKVSYAAGRVLHNFDWELKVRIDSSPGPGLMCVALEFQTIWTTFAQTQIAMILHILGENITYAGFYPAAPPTSNEAPADAVEEFQTFERTRAKTIQKLQQHNDRELKEGLHPHRKIQSYMLVRMEFEKAKLEFFAAPYEKLSGDGSQLSRTPLFSADSGEIRFHYDAVNHWDGVPSLFELGFYTNSFIAYDRRPQELRATPAGSRLLDIHSKIGFVKDCSDNWYLMPTRKEVQKPPNLMGSALAVKITNLDFVETKMKISLKNPQVFVLLGLLQDIAGFFGQAWGTSSFCTYPKPVWEEPKKDDGNDGTGSKDVDEGSEVWSEGDGDESTSDNTENRTRIVLKIDEAIVGLFTEYDGNADDDHSLDHIIQVGGSFNLEYVGFASGRMEFRKSSATNLVIRRTELGKAGGSQRHSFVQMLRLPQLHLDGEKSAGARPEMALNVSLKPMSMHLSTADVPHLSAALTQLGQDGYGKSCLPAQPIVAVEDSESEAEEVSPKSTETDSFRSQVQVPRTTGGPRRSELSLAVLGISNTKNRRSPGLSSLKLQVSARVIERNVEPPTAIPLAVGGRHVQVPLPPNAKKKPDCLVEVLIHLPFAASGKEAPGPALGSSASLTGETSFGLPPTGSAAVASSDDERVLLATLTFPLDLCLVRSRRDFRPSCALQESAARWLLQVSNNTSWSPETRGAASILAAELGSSNLVVHISSRYGLAREDMLLNQLSARASSADDEEALTRPVPGRGSGISFQAGAGEEPLPQTEEPVMATSLNLSLEGLEVSFLDDCRAKALPVLRLDMRSAKRKLTDTTAEERQPKGGISLMFNQWIGEVQNHGLTLDAQHCMLDIRYLNFKAGTWEPFLERFNFDVRLRTTDSKFLGREEDAISAKTELQFKSSSPFEVNLTPQFCSLANWLLSHREEYMRRLMGEDAEQGAGAGDARYRLLNLTGVPVVLSLFHMGSAASNNQGAMKWMTMPPSDAELPLDAILGDRSEEEWRKLADEPVAGYIKFQDASTEGEGSSSVGMMMASREVSTNDSSDDGQPDDDDDESDSDTEDSLAHILLSSASSKRLRRVFPGQGEGGEGETETAVCEVLAPHPSHHLMLITSTVRIFNHTNKELEMRFLQEDPDDSEMPFIPRKPLADSGRPLAFAASMDVVPRSVAYPEEVERFAQVTDDALPRDSSAAATRSLNPRSFMKKDTSTNSSFTSAMRSIATARVPASFAGSSDGSIGPADDAFTNVQMVPPGHFGSARLGIGVENAVAVQFRISGTSEWSSQLPLEEAKKGLPIVVPATPAAFRYQAHVLKSQSTNILPSVISVHLCSPWRLVNATPLSLNFRFTMTPAAAASAAAAAAAVAAAQQNMGVAPTVASAGAGAAAASAATAAPVRNNSGLTTSAMTVEASTNPGAGSGPGSAPLLVDVAVEAFGTATLPANLDPNLPYRLAISSSDPQIVAPDNTDAARASAGSKPVPKIFQQVPKAALDVLINLPDAASSRFGVALMPGFSCSVACKAWLVDRTGLDLRVLSGARRPTATTPALPCVSELHLLDCQTSSSIYLVQPKADMDDTWALSAQVKLPTSSSPVKYAMLSQEALQRGRGVPFAAGESDLLPVHVVLQTQVASTGLTYGAITQVVSVLPQVVIYNMADFPLEVRALDQAASSVKVEPATRPAATSIVTFEGGQLTPGICSFLRWQPNSKPAPNAKSQLTLQFRPSQLADHLDWSDPIGLDAPTTSPFAVALKSTKTPTTAEGLAATVLRFYTVHVTEREGITCLTIERGAKQMLQNWSTLAESVTLKVVRDELDGPNPNTGALQQAATIARNRTAQAVQGIRSALSAHANQEPTFSAKRCETTEVAWSISGVDEDDLALELEVLWARPAQDLAGTSATSTPNMPRFRGSRGSRGSGGGMGPFASLVTTTCRLPSLNRPGSQCICKAPSGNQGVLVQTGITGDVRWIRIRDLAPQEASRRGTISSGHTGGTIGSNREPLPELSVAISLATVGLSAVSSRRDEELLYAELRQIGLRLLVQESVQTLELTVEDAQVDCQLLDYQYNPAVFANRGQRGIPFLLLRAKMPRPAPLQTTWFEELSIQLDDVELIVSRSFLEEVLQTLQDALGNLITTEGISQEQLDVWQARPLAGGFELPPTPQSKMWIDTLCFSGLKVNIWAHVDLMTLRPSIRRTLRAFVAGSKSFNVSGAQLKLKPKTFRDVSAIGSDLAKCYVFSIVKAAGSIIRSCTLFEIPVTFVWFMAQGASGIMLTLDFLVHHASDILEVATLDQEYMRGNSSARAHDDEEVVGLRSGLGVAGNHVVKGLWHLGDIVRLPVQGARRYGVGGFLKGLCRGVVGVVLKPAVEVGLSVRAVARAASMEFESLKERVPLGCRRRLPRVMYPGGAIRDYDVEAAKIAKCLRLATFPAGTSTKDQHFIQQIRGDVHEQLLISQIGVPPETQRTVMVLTGSKLCLLEIEVKGGRITVSLKWGLKIIEVKQVSATGEGVTIQGEVVEQELRGVGASRSVAASGLAGRIASLAPRRGTVVRRIVKVEYKIPCSEAARIQEIFRILRPLQSLGCIVHLPK